MIYIGLIGVGKFGKNYLRLLQNTPGVRLATVASASVATLSGIAVSDGIKKTTNPEEIFNDPRIDAVVVATPTETHFTLAAAALHGGKHVLLEKPMTATFEEAEELAKIAESSGKILMIGHQYCYNDYIHLLKAKIEQNFFGNILYVQAEHFYTRPPSGGIGCFWETATHEFAILDYLFGAFAIREKRVLFQDFLGKGRDDFASASFLLSDKFPVSLTVSWCAPEKIRRFQIVGKKGAAVFDETRDIKNPLRLYQRNGDGLSYQELSFSLDAKEPLQNEINHFISCINRRETPLSDYHHGLRVTRYLADCVAIDK